MEPADDSLKRVTTKLDGVYARATAAGIVSKSGKALDCSTKEHQSTR